MKKLFNALSQFFSRFNKNGIHETISFFHRSKRELIFLIIAFLLSILIISSVMIQCSARNIDKDLSFSATIKKKEKTVGININEESYFLLQDAIVYPDYFNRELTSDYIPLAPPSLLLSEQLMFLEKEIDVFIDEIIKDDLQFGFERREKK